MDQIAIPSKIVNRELEIRFFFITKRVKIFHNTIWNVMWKFALLLIMAYDSRKEIDKQKQWCPPPNYGWLKANAYS